jgi:hypothetical protein
MKTCIFFSPDTFFSILENNREKRLAIEDGLLISFGNSVKIVSFKSDLKVDEAIG